MEAWRESSSSAAHAVAEEEPLAPPLGEVPGVREECPEEAAAPTEVGDAPFAEGDVLADEAPSGGATSVQAAHPHHRMSAKFINESQYVLCIDFDSQVHAHHFCLLRPCRHQPSLSFLWQFFIEGV